MSIHRTAVAAATASATAAATASATALAAAALTHALRRLTLTPCSCGSASSRSFPPRWCGNGGEAF